MVCSGETRDLEIEIADVLLPGEDPEMVDLALVFVERRRGKVADAVDGKPEARGLARYLRDLKLTARDTEHGGQSRRRVDDAGDVGKAACLLGVVVDRVEGGRWVFDPQGILQVFAGNVII